VFFSKSKSNTAGEILLPVHSSLDLGALIPGQLIEMTAKSRLAFLPVLGPFADAG
jgi:hypothetical protein